MEQPHAHIVRLVRTALNVPYANVVLCAAEARWLYVLDGADPSDAGSLHPLCTAVMGARDCAVMTVSDTSAHPRFADAGPLEDAAGLRSFAGVPLRMATGEVVGVLYAADVAPRTFLAGECSMLAQLGDCVVRELELRQRAACDDLTGFLTRRPFFDGLHRTLSEYMREGTQASVAILDLDHFKTINDRFGHAAGDRVLSCVADVCRAILGDGVSFGRLGGEEFAFAFPGVGLEEAANRLSDLRVAIESVRLSGVPEMIVTGSIGVAALSEDIPTVSAWCKMADAALYGAKQAGRNCVIVSRHTMSMPPGRPLAPVLVHHAHEADDVRPRDAVVQGSRH